MKISQIRWILNWVCRITQKGLRCGFQNTSDKGQFRLKHIRINQDPPVNKRICCPQLITGNSQKSPCSWVTPNKWFVKKMTFKTLADFSQWVSAENFLLVELKLFTCCYKKLVGQMQIFKSLHNLERGRERDKRERERRSVWNQHAEKSTQGCSLEV